jgi:nucleotidyltransferase AbiEii toxin of type IV toxin-antitoxin system
VNPKVLPREAWNIVRKLEDFHRQVPWILAGGTGLALQLGHRVSLDLDFFREDGFDSDALRLGLGQLGRLEIQAQDADTLHTRFEGVRLSYLRAEAPFLFPPLEYRQLRIADARDIAAMKIVAIGGRGSRKDFVDLHAYLMAGGDFPALLEILRRKYANTSFNEVHLLRSLVFFEDAEQEPMPRMLRPTNWNDIRSRLEEEAQRWAP